MPDFFTQSPGIGIFLNAGDPPLDRLGDLLQMLDESGVSCVELAVPFPDSVTDGPIIRRSATRALARGVGLAETLNAIDHVRHRLKSLQVVLLADWRHTVWPLSDSVFTDRVADSGVDAVLVHGIPPMYRRRQFDLLATAGVASISTCYAQSNPEVQEMAARDATAFLYLVSQYGRSGANSTLPQALRAKIKALQSESGTPVAVGFGIRTAEDVRLVHSMGADGALVGSAAVQHLEQHGDPVELLGYYIEDLLGKGARDDRTSVSFSAEH